MAKDKRDLSELEKIVELLQDRVQKAEKMTASLQEKLSKTQEYTQTTIINDIPYLRKDIDSVKIRVTKIERESSEPKWWQFWR